ncbi:unnamed protein product [Phytomonas sp. EM1]|nr:unnamed protein product [Phytomonas sp. EM1]|eukprot:CCW62818.1 unnamed protein product [Phytomonas sp. isolate EM1]
MSANNNEKGALDVVDTSLTRVAPAEDMIMEYVSPLQDDSWVRQSVFVHIEELADPNTEMVHKKELLRAHALASMRKMTADKISNSDMPADMINDDENLLVEIPRRKDPILEGIEYQERFLEQYKIEHFAEDRVRASNYKQIMLQGYRRRNNETQAIEGKCTEADVPPPVQETPALVQKVKTPAPVQEEEAPAPVQEEEAPAPVQEEEAPAPVQEEEAPAPVQEEEGHPQTQEDV